MKIHDLVERYSAQGYTVQVAENIAAEEIILSKIASSEMADSVALKDGIVMYNLTKNARRATRDIDFDFIRHSISHESIKAFVKKLNAVRPEFKLKNHRNNRRSETAGLQRRQNPRRNFRRQ